MRSSNRTRKPTQRAREADTGEVRMEAERSVALFDLTGFGVLQEVVALGNKKGSNKVVTNKPSSRGGGKVRM